VSIQFSSGVNLQTRLTCALPAGSSPEALRGRYRVFFRCAVHSTLTTTTYRIRYRQPGTDPAPGPLVEVTIPNGQFRLVDLGLIDFPHATTAPPAIGFSGLAPGFTSGQIEIQVERVSGTSAMDADYVYLMPADERYCEVRQGSVSGYLILDGPNDATYCMAAGSSPFDASAVNRVIDQGAGGVVPRIGGLPVLVPGVTNRWYMLTGTGTITDTKTIEVSYWPLWREVAS
jgi:hypothetical protein